MKQLIAAALLTMPLSLFAQGGSNESGAPAAGTTEAPAATAPAPAAAPTPAAAAVTCVGSEGTDLTADQKKALKEAKVSDKAMKKFKGKEVAHVDECKGKYTIENGKAAKVMQKAHHHNKN